MEIYGLTRLFFWRVSTVFGQCCSLNFWLIIFVFGLGRWLCFYALLSDNRTIPPPQSERAATQKSTKTSSLSCPTPNWWLDNAWNSRHLPFVCGVLFCLNINTGWFHCYAGRWLSRSVWWRQRRWPFQRAALRIWGTQNRRETRTNYV